MTKCADVYQVIELFKASDKYDVDGLLRECIHTFHKITKARHVAFLLQVLALLKSELSYPFANCWSLH